jgi:hypothetical protein
MSFFDRRGYLFEEIGGLRREGSLHGCLNGKTKRATIHG